MAIPTLDRACSLAVLCLEPHIDRSKKALTEKQKKFCHEYMIDFNASAAYIRAGYSKNGARISASQLLTNPNVRIFLSGLIHKQEENAEITVQEIIRDLKTMKDRCMQQIQVFDKKGNPTGEWRFDSAGAVRSLELLGKHLAMFTDKFQVEDKDLHITVIMVDIKHVIMQVQQVITHHISDPEVRNRITRELEEIKGYKERRKKDN